MKTLTRRAVLALLAGTAGVAALGTLQQEEVHAMATIQFKSIFVPVAGTATVLLPTTATVLGCAEYSNVTGSQLIVAVPTADPVVTRVFRSHDTGLHNTIDDTLERPVATTQFRGNTGGILPVVITEVL